MDFHEVSYEHNMLVKEGNQKPAIPSMGEYGAKTEKCSLELVKDLGVHGGGHDVPVGDAPLAVLVLQVHFQLPEVDWGQPCPWSPLPTHLKSVDNFMW